MTVTEERFVTRDGIEIVPTEGLIPKLGTGLASLQKRHKIPAEKWAPVVERVRRHRDTYVKVGAILRKAGEELLAAGCLADGTTLTDWLYEVTVAVLDDGSLGKIEEPYWDLELDDVMPNEALQPFLQTVDAVIVDGLYEGLGIYREEVVKLVK
ncbi:hypothetical protein BH20ACT22_BH20ACT22_11060 [soil metagenome]